MGVPTCFQLGRSLFYETFCGHDLIFCFFDFGFQEVGFLLQWSQLLFSNGDLVIQIFYVVVISFDFSFEGFFLIGQFLLHLLLRFIL